MNLPVNHNSDEGATDAAASDDGATEHTDEVQKSPGGTGELTSNPEHSTSTGAGDRAPGTDAARPAITRRKLDEIFGDVLPATTRDERDEGRDRSNRDDDERWYRDNRPPHHG